MAIEYIVGPVLALLLGMKFTHYTDQKHAKKHEEIEKMVEEKIVESNTLMSQQMLKVMTPVAQNMSKINSQLGL